MPEFSSGEEKTLAYDLRIFYAGILGKKMVKIEMAQERKDYIGWFRELKLMFPMVRSRVEKDRELIKDKFKKKVEDFNGLAHKYTDVYFRRSSDSKGTEQLEQQLLDMTQFIYRIMDQNKLFGENIDIGA